VVAAASNHVRSSFPATLLACLVIVLAPSVAGADPRSPSISDADILGGAGSPMRVESVTTRMTAIQQDGHGYQSQAGPVLGPGSERLTVFEPQAEIVATQGDRLRHRVWVPLDMVTAASPNSIARSRPDALTGASRHVEGGTIDWTATYKSSARTDVSMRTGMHLENPFRSWLGGVGANRSFADQNTVLAGSLLGIIDWFDRFDITGQRFGRTERSTTTASLSLTRIVTSSTVVNVNYGITVQEGELGNTWNSVPLASGMRGAELLPSERVRHALVARMSQFLPWNGALRLYYRFYADDWGIAAHSIEGQWMQRLTPTLYVGGLYRFHTQTRAFFFTTLAPIDAPLRVADSDLAPLDSHTIGGKIVGDVPVDGVARTLHYELEYDRYFRTNDLWMNIVTCSIGLRF
jgi:uncharacterized protein DUF3570